ncbi:histidine phosphatase family protein [Thiocapsa bogorovii]|uniref:histidine phosphatase family protein n=1 Tax=Thiocapsa bogorovii TaxID=521689 RepID=UPI001E4A1D93|nr:histidine phosphatase family protein [Thiocapsa bogorovii]UHD14378.1 histidine phosphatase family protein [Thiocapsa bogorovii]
MTLTTDMDSAYAPTTICVTRHGETDWNITGVLQGWIDVPLNENGRQQALEMADAFRGSAFSRVWTSPLSRAAETARIVAEVLELPPPIRCEGLKERNFGRIQGMTKRNLSIRHPGLHANILRRDPDCRFDDGESPDEFADRVVRALHEMAGRHPGERVLAVTHGWVMDVITRYVRQLPRTLVLDMKRKNGESLWLLVTAGSAFTVSDAGGGMQVSSGSGDRV